MDVLILVSFDVVKSRHGRELGVGRVDGYDDVPFGVEACGDLGASIFPEVSEFVYQSRVITVELEGIVGESGIAVLERVLDEEGARLRSIPFGTVRFWIEAENGA